jgi:outer membrane protein OmpA-like peptidoglycan-associated protein
MRNSRRSTIAMCVILCLSGITTGAAQPATQQNLPAASDPVIYSNGNSAAVQNNPTRETTFAIDASHRVTFIYTYHYLNNSKVPGTIALRHSDGTVYGPWQASGALGPGGVSNAYWFVRPNVGIKPGTYTVLDSDRATWSQNAASSGAGFVAIRGVRTDTAQSATPLNVPAVQRTQMIQNEAVPKLRDVKSTAVATNAQLLAVLQPIYFAFDKYDLSPDAIQRLDAIATFLKEYPAVRVLVEGHTDVRGTAEYSVTLGFNRARAAETYLTDRGIYRTRIVATSYGKERPASPNCGTDNSCHAKNNRDEWLVLAK